MQVRVDKFGGGISKAVVRPREGDALEGSLLVGKVAGGDRGAVVGHSVFPVGREWEGALPQGNYRNCKTGRLARDSRGSFWTVPVLR